MSGRELGWVAGVFMLAGLTGCGPTPAVSEASNEKVANVEQFVTWTPAQHFVDEHVSWHGGDGTPCSASGQPLSGQAGVGRRCGVNGTTGMGEDFLIWHHAFVERLRDEYQVQGLSGDITPWYSVPAEIKASGSWSAQLDANVDAAMNTFINPNTGLRFASLDEYGRFIENSFHGSLHVASAAVWGQPGGTDPDVGLFTSPRSTLFFKIHGFIDFLFQKFIAGDFNWDGKSDVVLRRNSTNATKIALMDDSHLSSTVTVSTAPTPTSCNWYVGATTDLDFNGRTDLVWHGPGCNRTQVWLMSSATTVLSPVELPAVDSSWTLIGAADLNQDLRPDLFWRNNSSRNLSVWLMNNMTQVGSQAISAPSGWTPILVGDVSPDGQPNLFHSRISNGVPQYGVTTGTGTTVSLLSFSGRAAVLDLNLTAPKGIGRYRNHGTAADLVFEDANSEYQVAWFSSLTGSAPGYVWAPTTVLLSTLDDVQGPR